MKVTYMGASKEQVNWGSGDDPRKILTIGKEYEVEEKEVRSWHTKIKLKGIDGWFNSAAFDELSVIQ